MSNSFKQPGKTLTLVAPYNRSSGEGFKVGKIFAIAEVDVSSGDEVEGVTEGVHEITKATGAVSQGDPAYWDDSAKKVTGDSAAGMLIGAFTAAALSGDATAMVKLNGTAPDASEGAQAAEADLVDNGGGATADGTIGAVTNPTLSDWNGSSVYPSAAQATAIGAAFTALKDAIKELSTKQNALLAKLRLAGVIDA